MAKREIAPDVFDEGEMGPLNFISGGKASQKSASQFYPSILAFRYITEPPPQSAK